MRVWLKCFYEAHENVPRYRKQRIDGLSKLLQLACIKYHKLTERIVTQQYQNVKVHCY